MGDCGGLWGTAGGLPGKAGDGEAVGGGRDGKCETFPTGDGGAPSPWLWMVGQVWKKTGRENTTSSTAVPLQDGRTAPLRTLTAGQM